METFITLLTECETGIKSVNKNFGRMPLLWAAEKGYEGIVKILLAAKAGGESKPKDKDGSYAWTPLWLALNGRHEGIFKLLLKVKANVKSINKDEQTLIS